MLGDEFCCCSCSKVANTLDSIEHLPPEGCGDVGARSRYRCVAVYNNVRPGNRNLLQPEGGGSVQKGGEFCIVCLLFSQSLWGNGHADCFHAGQSVGDHIVLPRDMPDVRRELRELRYKVKMVRPHGTTRLSLNGFS